MHPDQAVIVWIVFSGEGFKFFQNGDGVVEKRRMMAPISVPIEEMVMRSARVSFVSLGP